MRCGAATAHVVVIHTRQIIVDEGVGVNALDRTSGWESGLARTSACFRRKEAQNGAHALATRKNAVAHGTMYSAGACRFSWEPHPECTVNGEDVGGKVLRLCGLARFQIALREICLPTKNQAVKNGHPSRRSAEPAAQLSQRLGG